jgi:hypothetical protein
MSSAVCGPYDLSIRIYKELGLEMQGVFGFYSLYCFYSALPVVQILTGKLHSL